MMTTEAPVFAPEDYLQAEGERPMSLNHAAVQMRLGIELSASDDFSVFPELGLELPDGQGLTPDLAVYPKMTLDWQMDIIRMKVMPKLAVEIFSPTQGYQEINVKLRLYFAHGVESVWIVHPAMQTIAIYQPGAARPLVFSTGEAKDPVTGISAQLEEIFDPN